MPDHDPQKYGCFVSNYLHLLSEELSRDILLDVVILLHLWNHVKSIVKGDLNSEFWPELMCMSLGYKTKIAMEVT